MATININVEADSIEELHNVLKGILGTSAPAPVQKQETPVIPVQEIQDYLKETETPVPVQEQETPVPVQEQETPEPILPPIPEGMTGLPIVSDNNEIELDNEGLPWDARIHSTKKSKTKLKCWKVLRIPKSFNDDTQKWLSYVESVKNELRIKYALPDNGNDFNDDPNDVFKAVEPSPPTDMDGILSYLATISDSSIPLDVCEAMNIVNVFELHNKPELIPEFYQRASVLAKINGQ